MYKIYLKFHEDLLSGCRDMGGTKSHRNGQIVIINRMMHKIHHINPKSQEILNFNTYIKYSEQSF